MGPSTSEQDCTYELETRNGEHTVFWRCIDEEGGSKMVISFIIFLESELQFNGGYETRRASMLGPEKNIGCGRFR